VAVEVRIEINGSALNRLLRSPNGPVARDMLKRGQKVQAAAKRRINSRTGALARSLNVEVVIVNGTAGARVGTDLYYAKFVHDGTGIYGPSHRPIRPNRARALSFSGRTGAVVVANSRGQRGTHFLRNSRRAAR
jgi:Bacteriophage HK97-gp10, putative tail-component